MTTPNHLAIIMDGNGRWATARNKPRIFGHIKGARVARKIISAASDRKIKNLTLFTFSSENWLRPKEEVQFLMRLFAHRLRREQQTLLKNNIRFNLIGDIARLPDAVKKIALETAALTEKNTGMVLTFAISYGGRQEIVATTKRIAEKVASGQLKPSDIDEACFASHLESPTLSDPDIIIRTSGELRISNFFLWQSAYSEIYFVKTPWPEFTERDLDAALDRFNSSERRFGRIPTEIELR